MVARSRRDDIRKQKDRQSQTVSRSKTDATHLIGEESAIDTDSDREETNDGDQDQHDQDSAMHQMVVPLGFAIL
jgi:hypothetical protein